MAWLPNYNKLQCLAERYHFLDYYPQDQPRYPEYGQIDPQREWERRSIEEFPKYPADPNTATKVVIYNLPREVDEARLAQDLAPFGQVLNISITRSDLENQAAVLMARGPDAIQAADFLQKVYGFNARVEQTESVGIREIWTGNLAQTVTQEKLYKHFFIYGEIEMIDMFMFKNFAFVRFKEVTAAARALDLAKNVKIDGRPIKISFADPVRRKEALGDSPGYVFNEHTAKALLFKYTTVTMSPPEEAVKGTLNRYGSIKAILTLETPQDPMFKPHIFVEFSTHVFPLDFITKIGRGTERTILFIRDRQRWQQTWRTG
eukprot:TRINITY_DN88060_c0_g1_i1.p2 TRINITY_DN88060_c0_g1~~TRINITY_DN88060_c0_g1_i1.p2  ORF type:complete len:318 (-),score=29.78 TRINITY_DN88060_c0_g1_i1:1365-2318(-)